MDQILVRRRVLGWLLCAGVAAGASTASLAASINHGDFGPDPPGVTMYLDVTESSGTDPVPPERYGPPQIDGDTLDFDPTGFVASATSGTADVTDIQLNLDIMLLELNDVVAGGMETLLISESGEFSLLGTGTAATSVTAGVSVTVDILEVDGDPITPISVFASNSIMRDLVTDGPVALAPWSNGVLIEFGPVLTANGVDFDFGVTKAQLVFDDQLVAISEAASVAFIAKKDFRLEPGIVPNMPAPEPSAALLLFAAAAGLAAARRRGLGRAAPPRR
jgi:hypothetical protein